MPEKNSTEIFACRLCGSEKLSVLLDLGSTPPANNFLSKEQLDGPEESFPIVVVQCGVCGCTQLKHNINPEILFSNYLYESSTSPSFVKHFEKYTDELLEKCALKPGDFVVEFGSNDGIMLRPMKAKGLNVLGVEPAKNLAEKSKQEGFSIINDFFTPEVALGILRDNGSAKLIVGNNVFAHTPHLDEMVQAIKILLDKDGWFVFENQYLLDLFEKGLFDLWYHEHFFSHNVKSLDLYFKKFGLRLVDVQRVPTHGGSIRGFVKLDDGQASHFESVESFIKQEEQAGMFSSEKWKEFRSRMERVKSQLKQIFAEYKSQGKKICAYSYAAKSTTLCNYLEIGDIFDFVVEDAKSKIGLFTPKFHVPIMDKSELKKADVAVILAWNFEKVIRENNADYKGQWVVPLPEVKLY